MSVWAAEIGPLSAAQIPPPHRVETDAAESEPISATQTDKDVSQLSVVLVLDLRGKTDTF